MKHFGRILLIILAISMVLQPFCVFASEPIQGDMNGDGKLTAYDAREILILSVTNEKQKRAVTSKADINGDGVIGALDARAVLRISIGLSYEGRLKGYTEKGYPVYEKDGLTFIDGVLIANKTYSLPEDYAPDGLLSECENAFSLMKKDAAAKGLSIYISSGYRSYSYQENLYNRYVRRDGKALADTYSARPGHSEHQTGLAIDLNTVTRSFGNTKEGKWVAAHCHEYGFIIRYPEGKSHITGYSYEPWHLRYVGVETAKRITESGLCLEEYYGITSVYS